MATPIDLTINGRRVHVGHFPPSQALPLMGRLLAFFGPVVEGVAGEGVRAIVRGIADLKEDTDASGMWTLTLDKLQRIVGGVNWDAVLGGAFRVGWGRPEFAQLVRDLFACVTYEDGPRKDAPFLDAYDAGPDWLTGPEGTEGLVRVLAAVVRGNFALPFFSRTFGGLSEFVADSAKAMRAPRAPTAEASPTPASSAATPSSAG